jgi:hypothetical protein
MRFACWTTKATDTHTEYVIIFAFPRQGWLRERASMLRHTYLGMLNLAQWLRHCATNLKVAGIDSRRCLEFFIDNPSGRTMALGSTQPLTQMSKGKGNGLPLAGLRGLEGE